MTNHSGMTRAFRLLAFSLSCFLFLAVSVQAATVRINPTKIRLSISPGESNSGVIEVDNPSEDSIIVKAYLEDWAYTSAHDGTKDFFPAGSTPFSSSSWISTSLSEFVVPAFGKQTVHYTIRVPENASGGHYAVLFFESLLSNPEAGESARLGVMVRIGALFYIEAQGSIRRGAEIKNFSLKRKSSGSPLEMGMDLKNTGNVDITCAGTFHIMDGQGMIFARGELNNVYIFPEDTAKLTASWNKSLSKGKYSLIMTLDLGKALEEAHMGRGPVITKETELVIGDNGEVVRIGELQ